MAGPRGRATGRPRCSRIFLTAARSVHTVALLHTIVKPGMPPSELHLRSKSEDESMARASADVGVVLDHRLQKNHWSDVKQNVELETVLCLRRWHPGSAKP